MPISMKLWRVGKESELNELPASSLEAESILEDWIANKGVKSALDSLVEMNKSQEQT